MLCACHIQAALFPPLTFATARRVEVRCHQECLPRADAAPVPCAVSAGIARLQDNYSKPITHAYHPGDWLDHTSRAHPCFDPKKVGYCCTPGAQIRPPNGGYWGYAYPQH